MLAVDSHESRASDNGARSQIDCRERTLLLRRVASLSLFQERGQFVRMRYQRDRDRPQLSVCYRSGKTRQVLRTQRLECDAHSSERDALDGLGWAQHGRGLNTDLNQPVDVLPVLTAN